MPNHHDKMKEVAEQQGKTLTDNEIRSALFMIGIDEDNDNDVDIDAAWYLFGFQELQIIKEAYHDDYDSVIKNPPAYKNPKSGLVNLLDALSK